jgi:GNAT superfamily N-acetyltransferase
MALSKSIKLLPATTEAQWLQAQGLIQELIDWDVRECEALGFDGDDVVRTFYPDCLAEIRHQSVAPGGCFLIATSQGAAAGCAGYRPLAEGACELYDVYVAANYRGLGIGVALVEQLQCRAIRVGYRTMYLETASFMMHAHKLYRSLRFEAVPPYRPVPDRFVGFTISMQCTL